MKNETLTRKGNVTDWKAVLADAKKTQWSVILIDHRDEERADTAIALKDTAQFIVLHDANPEHEKYYGYDRVYPHFKYRHDWTFSKSFTAVVSNLDDLSRLK